MAKKNPTPRFTRAPTSLPALPDEIKTHIVSSLDRSSAISLSLVCRSLRPTAAVRLCRDLDIFLNPSYGVRPTTRVRLGPQKGEEHNWDGDRFYEDVKAAEECQREALEEKVERIIEEGGEKLRWAVKKVTVQRRPGNGPRIIGLLEIVSPKLEELVFLSTNYNEYDDRFSVEDTDTLDHHFIHSGLRFPSLRHIRIDQHGIRFAELVFLLLDAAPNLTSLDVDVRLEQLPHRSEKFPDLPPATALKKLRLRFMERINVNLETEEEEEKWDLSHPMFRLLSRCHSLEQLAIEYVDGENGRWQMMFPHIVKAISHLSGLRDLHWSVDGDVIHDILEERGLELSALRRIVVYGGLSLHSSRELYTVTMPNLQAIYCEPQSRTKSVPPQAGHPLASVAGRLHPGTATRLRQQPHLSREYVLPHLEADIFRQLDHIEAEGHFDSWVRSYKHGNAEIIHVRDFSRFVEQSDTPHAPSDALASPDPNITITVYETPAGELRRKLSKRQDVVAWRDETDLDGMMCVPLDIVQKMRRVQGGGLEQWERRGVEVGDAAWAVLMAWKESQVA